MVALFLFFVLFSIHCLQVMYLLKKTESISKITSQEQLRDSEQRVVTDNSERESKC